MSLPVLDLSKYMRGNAPEQAEFGRDLLKSLQAHGFVKLVNHGFDRNYIDELMDWVGDLERIFLNISLYLTKVNFLQSHRFFKLSPSTKASISHQKGVNPQRGYSGIGGENFKIFALDGTGEDYVDVKVYDPSLIFFIPPQH